MSSTPGLASTPEPPYYAVIFTSRRTADDPAYDTMAAAMVRLAAQQEGYLGLESARGVDGTGITVSYWRDEESIRRWKADLAHREAQRRGREEWYADYRVRVCRVERAYGGP